MKTNYAASLAGVALVALVGCAEPARQGEMVPQGISKVPASSSLSNRIASVTATGGEKTNPLWTSEISSEEFRSAVEQSLQAAGMFSAGGDLRLETFLLEVDQPLMGFDLTVMVNARYRIVDGRGRVRFDRTIKSSYVATFSDAFMGSERLKLANEGAARENILLFINTLKASGLSRPVAAVS